MAHAEDSNGDGLLDPVCQVEKEELLLEPGDSVAHVTGATYGGEQVKGQDYIQIVPDN